MCSLFSRLDFLVFVITLYFFVTTLTKDDCFSAECPAGIRTWFVGSFLGFYTLQLLIFTMFRTANRQYALTLFLVASFGVVPLLLIWNIWGNTLEERLNDKEHKCVYNGAAQSIQLLFLISIYCSCFIYLIFVFVVRECMRRFYIVMDMNPTIMRARFNMSDHKVSLLKDRSLLDSQDALAYAFWFLIYGRVGSRADRNYLDAEI